MAERMTRRLVNIIAERRNSGMYTLHRLDASKHLFFPSRAAAEAAAANKPIKVPILAWLPAAAMRFGSSPTTMWDAGKLDMFAAMCEDRILCSNKMGHISLYNAYYGCIETMPPLNGGKGSVPMAVSIARPGELEQDLYVMNTSPYLGNNGGLSTFLADLPSSPSCFDVLRFGKLGSDDDSKEESPMRMRGWHWDPLPPPPFTDNVMSHTVVGGGDTICVSTVPSSGDGRTYCFDTVKREWRKAGGGWVLPAFDGAAEYVPDLNLWLGFCSDSQQLCGWDLSAIKDDKAPALQHSWKDLPMPEEWSASRIFLLNLGAGSFCIAKTFRVVSSDGEASFFDEDSVEDKFAVLTGIEMVTDDKQGLKMIRHKSVRYMFTNEMIRWVL